MLKPWKICMIIDSWDPILGGAQVHTKELVARLINNYGCEVHLITRNIRVDDSKKKYPHIESLMDGKFKIYRLGPKAKFHNLFARIWWCIYAGFYTRKLHIKNGFDLIHAHAFLSAYPARFGRFLCGLPIVYTIHGTSLFYKKGGLQAQIERDLLTKISYDHVITVAENFLQLKGVNKKISVIPNGIDVSAYDKVKSDREPDDVFRVLYVGRFDPIKGLKTLIKGVSLLRNDVGTKQMEVRLVGYGYEIDKLKKLIAKLHLGRVFKFVGRLEGEALIKEYKNADLFVLPSYSEGQSLTLMEACACKLPILATQVGDNAKLVKENINGFLMQPGNADEIKQYLEIFMNNPHLKNMGEQSRAILDGAGMTWDVSAEKTYNVYQRVMIALKGVPVWSKIKDFLREPRLPHMFFSQSWRYFNFSKIYTKKINLSDPVLCSLTVDVERNYGSAADDSDTDHTEETCEKFFTDFNGFCEQQELKSTLFVQGSLVPKFATQLKEYDEKGHEIGVHGMYHELWAKAKWFLQDRPLTKAEKMLFMEQAMANFEKAGLHKPVSFRAPNMVINEKSCDVLAHYGFKYDSSFASFRGRDFGIKFPIPYKVGDVHGVPVSFDPLPHFVRRALIVPISNYWVMNLYYLLSLSDSDLEEAIKRILWSQKKAKVKPHLVFLAHSWEFESCDQYPYCNGENYSKLAKKFYMLRQKFNLKFLTFENLCKEVWEK
ncbi:MAG: glycosyl transferase group 1 [uncultured bacterium]|nr:MAG: glycosyl transferase group 1 [uncultured bacterium]OGJ47057.1 MAG: hypothetical protein A2244_04950 [Candidatus Peregrinibacteria bacterium RIFOXYA2_FULL_41_18]OGJ52634.1 MAG: hypothetical protein A2448_00190 [Candidatus Peregrinibacteria bacterium RIFOXYC2_FULL_41_22]